MLATIKKVLIYFFLIVFSVLSLVPAYIGLRDYLPSRKAASWEKVIAHVQSIDWESSEVESMEGDASGFSYEIHISYSYVFEGQDYTNDKIAFGYANNSVEPHYELFLQLEENPDFYVFVNPQNPQESVIITGWLNVHISLILVSLSLLSLIFTIFVLGFLRRRGKTAIFLVAILLISWISMIFLTVNEEYRISLAEKVEYSK
ncbi:MAG: DUF3592 domain-containing protein [Bacteroidales bacterium]|nr:DUF3592 domain-containing protein [Bacteroidales bacterium]